MGETRVVTLETGRFVSALNRSKKTAQTYRAALSLWDRFLDGKEPTRDTAQEWINQLVTEGEKKANTISTYANATKCYFRWRDGVRIHLEVPAIERGEVKSHPLASIRKLLDLGNPMERALVGMVFDTGCRISEIINLSRGDVDWDRRVLKVVRKGGHEEEVSITEQGLEFLRDWLERREGNPKEIFLSHLAGSDIDAKLRTARIRLIALADQAQIGKFTPSQLRHSRAMYLKNNDVPLERVSELLGHKSFGITEQLYGKKGPENQGESLKGWK